MVKSEQNDAVHRGRLEIICLDGINYDILGVCPVIEYPIPEYLVLCYGRSIDHNSGLSCSVQTSNVSAT